MRELAVLVHHPEAGPSAFSEVLAEAAGELPSRHVEVSEGEPLPTDLDALAGVLVLGGAMSAVAPARHGWMLDELAFLERAVEAEVPVLGVCLGAQLLGTALGGSVRHRARPQVGLVPLRRTTAGRDDEVTGGWTDGVAALFLHEDEVDERPSDAVPLLEGGDGVPAWRAGSAVAVQFHPEVTAAQLERWTSLDSVAGVLAAAEVAAAPLVEEMARREPVTVPSGRALLGRWLDGRVLDASGH